MVLYVGGTQLEAGGITMVDNWILDTAFTGDADPITSNLSRNNSAPHGIIGSAMTESSGIFTFPSTGIYKITFYLTTAQDGYGSTGDNEDTYDDGQILISINSTTDNSTYADCTYGSTFTVATKKTWTYTSAKCEAILDVTNTTNCKVSFGITTQNDDTSLEASSSGLNRTWMSFIRLGDT